MGFIADLHIHSRFSMATSRSLNIAQLAGWAMRKGIDVLGTGDFTHPGWLAELERDLKPDEKSGFYLPAIPPDLPSPVPDRPGPWFCPQAEISCVYKRDGKTRKVHNLVFMPDFAAARRFNKRLALIGNLASDGRPILRLDSRDLLEIALECSGRAVLIPAHIWTPWYALFGSKSGFDRIEDCYGDLTRHIFALETGLSSDPQMNRLVSALDNYALVSNSDAHSAPNLGREANLFSGEPSWDGMFSALLRAAKREKAPEGECEFLGTCEFYPEEGKYHLDGHRACGVVLDPEETKALGNICPVCGKPLTIGVLHRVTDLADRLESPDLALEPEARMLIPLPEIVGQILSASPASAKVSRKCAEIVADLGAELDVLCLMDPGRVSAFWEPLGEAVRRVRKKEIQMQAGFDGQYGKLAIFEAGDR